MLLPILLIYMYIRIYVFICGSKLNSNIIINPYSLGYLSVNDYFNS